MALTNIDMALPNVYLASVQSAITGETHHMYVAADFVGAAVRKVTNLCADRLGFRPYRSTATIKLRRLKLQDYLDHPKALGDAISNAKHLGERETVARLQHRPRQVAQALHEAGIKIDHEAVACALGQALRELESLSA